VLLLAHKQTYRLEDLEAAARALGVRLTLGTNRCHVLAEHWDDDVLTLDLTDGNTTLDQVRPEHTRDPFSAVMGSCDLTTELAAVLSQALHLKGNPPHAAMLARHKGALRECLSAAGVPTPAFAVFDLDARGQAPLGRMCQHIDEKLGWPVVIKPLLLSGSRGVMRADNMVDLARQARRLSSILKDPELVASGEADHARVLVESYVDGVEVALEGLLLDGELHVLALFDKPDPLEGPFFEETLYVTPSRHPLEWQAAAASAVQAATRAMALDRGPVHAEMRITPDGRVFVIEAAARSIGGLCSRMLRFGTGRSLDEVVLMGVLGLGAPLQRREGAVGVMMLPIPRAGTLQGVDGAEDALRVPHVREVTITARAHEELVPLPEGGSYLGFLFAQADTPADVENALREGHRRLKVSVTARLPRA
jgi:biotin carboxylase